MSWSNENKSCIRVDKREFAWEFHQLSCPGQTRTRVASELTSESLHESFINSHDSCPGQTKTRVAWELTSQRVCMGVSSTVCFHLLIQIPKDVVKSMRRYYGTRFKFEATVCGVKTESKDVYARLQNRNYVFIQTDKPIYKPGQKSMNRLFLLELINLTINWFWIN